MKRVALKGMQPRERQSAFQESRLLQRLRHPHIVSYQDSFVNKQTNSLCLVMTFCPGGDLHAVVQDHRRRNKRIEEVQVVQWLYELTLALQYVHERHIIHRCAQPDLVRRLPTKAQRTPPPLHALAAT